MVDDADELKDELHYLFHPEPDEDGFVPYEYPHPRLKEHHKLDLGYMDSLHSYEGATTHRYTRLCPAGDEQIRMLTKNQDVPTRLFETGMQLYGDSLIAYLGKDERKGDLHYYPPVILTFWSGFETFVRLASELMLTTVRSIPNEVAAFLRDEESWVNKRGEVHTRAKYQPILDRFAVLLRHGYGLQIDRGATYWQRLEAAKDLRDYYTHLDVANPRAISSDDVLAFMEDILLAVIWPSALLQRSLLLGMYRLYGAWVILRDRSTPYVERPFFLDWSLRDRYMFHCNFEGVDTVRYPNMDDEGARREQ